MKNYTVGRATDCDIIIPAESDSVSRQHLVVGVDFFGKLTVTDKSSNGTFVNDNKIQKGTPVPVKRTDIVRLGDDTILDWNRIPDGYRGMRMAVYAFIGLALCCVVGGVIYFATREDKPADTENVVTPADSDSIKAEEDSIQDLLPAEKTVEEVKTVEKVQVKKAGKKSVKKQDNTSRIKNKTNKGKDDAPVQVSKEKSSPEPEMRIRHSNSSEKD